MVQETPVKKILLINGSPNEKGCSFTALDEIAGELSKNGVGSEILWLGKKPMGAAESAGVSKPEYEPHVFTNFI